MNEKQEFCKSKAGSQGYVVSDDFQYNGEEEQEAESVLKLSHSFCQKTDEPELELIVKVLNINLDKKQRILETCCLLKEYMLLVDKIRKYAAEYKDINRAAEQAVTECIEENILADFLRKNRTEAIEVCIFEYDEKREKELIRKAEYAEGKKDGLKEGLREGQKQGEKRVFGIYRLYRDKYTENQIAEQMKIDVDEVRNILEKFKEQVRRLVIHTQICLHLYRVYIPGTGSSGVRVEWNVHGKNGICVLWIAVC